MCPREKLNRNLGIMPLKDFENVIKMFDNFKGEIHLHGYGEPLLDSCLIEKVKLARKYHPESIILFASTLGVKVEKGFFFSLIEAGISTIGVSFYGANKTSYKKIHGIDNFEIAFPNVKMLSYENSLAKKRIPIVILTPDEAMLKAVNLKKEDFSKIFNSSDYDFVNESHLHNYGYGRKYSNPKNRVMCSIVEGTRKDILQITWDLNVVPCCFDFNSSVVLGNLKNKSLQEIFISDDYKKFIEAHLYQNFKEYPLCQNCDRSF